MIAHNDPMTNPTTMPISSRLIYTFIGMTISQGAAILYPGTAFFDPQFITTNSYPLGIPQQGYIEIINLALVGLASYLALRRGARWAGSVPAMT